MSERSAGEFGDERLVEVDEHLRPYNEALAIGSAAVAPVFLPVFGIGFAIFLVLPLVWWALRAVGTTDSLGLRGWILGLLFVVSVTISGGAVTSGGTDSPVVFFAGIIGLGAQAFFPEKRWTASLGLAVIASVAGTDLFLGRPPQYFALAAEALLAAYLPLTVRRLVDLEHLHRRSAVLDPLTGCLNRRSLETRIDELEAHAERTQGPISIISIDIDHFRAINDTHGHSVGDQVLEHVSYVIRKQLRRFELFYRLGGEEFAILLPETELDVAATSNSPSTGQVK